MIELKDITEVNQIVKKQIETEHRLGEQAGGSGHLSYVSYRLGNLKIEIKAKREKLVTYWYTLFIESEFTVEPDNPPYEYNYCRSFKIVDRVQITEPVECKSGTADIPEWARAKQEIGNRLKTRYDSEWDNGIRPLSFDLPPQFIELIQKNSDFYICLLNVGDGNVPTLIKSGTHGGLLKEVYLFLENL
ncbi:MAG: hypothetical protein JXR31_17105 [Prolixibacteraceae bacterium]|nr:hypothetical protein [Prolixibacteraceae bacterium]